MLRPPHLARVACACVLALASCAEELAPVPPPVARGAAPATAPRDDLVDEAAARGLDYVNRSGDAAKTDILAANGAGVALLDLEGDGDLDVVFAQGLASLAQAVTGPGADLEVFRNVGGGRFERAPGPGLSGWWTGLATGDVDGDGDADLVAGGYGALVVLLQDADGALHLARDLCADEPARLVPGAERAVGAPPPWVTSVALFDADRDGALDLYAGLYLDLDPLAPVLHEVGEGPLAVPCRWKEHEVYCGPRGLVPQPDRFYAGDGAGGFVERTRAALGALPAGYTLAVLPSDVDDDGDVDVLVANDSSENRLLVNDGAGHFEDRGYEAGIALSMEGNPEAGMGIACGDVDRDGRFDYAVTNFSDEPTALYLGSELGFENATFRYALGRETRALLSWSAHLVDFDGDGWLELFTTNGHVYPQADLPLSGTSYGQPDTLWRLGPEPRAVPVAPRDARSLLAPATGSRGAAIGDVDGDGRPDVVVARLDGPCALGIDRFRGGHRLVLHLAGPEAPSPHAPRTPRDASGARVVLVAGQGAGEFGQLREVQTAQGYQSASSPALCFGLGDEARYAKLVVRWPSGAVEELDGGAADRALWIEEGRGVVRAEALP
ncbi:MAG: CRTAC1 family protein [Planctomycetes bacterium]|nr:CRTAC1 family protein [Planctomycetota bacterium]